MNADASFMIASSRQQARPLAYPDGDNLAIFLDQEDLIIGVYGSGRHEKLATQIDFLEFDLVPAKARNEVIDLLAAVDRALVKPHSEDTIVFVEKAEEHPVWVV
jgi:hypothetical protein